MDFDGSRREITRVCKFCGREFKTRFRALNHCLDCSEISDRRKREQHARYVAQRRAAQKRMGAASGEVRELRKDGLPEPRDGGGAGLV